MSKNMAEHAGKQKLDVSHKESLRLEHESARESAIYDKLKKGPVFVDAIEDAIPRTPLVDQIKKLITPTRKPRLYNLVIGEHGTGKTGLIKLAVKAMGDNEPKGVVYVNIPLQCNSEVNLVNAMREAWGWRPDEVIDSKGRKYSSSFP